MKLLRLAVAAAAACTLLLVGTGAAQAYPAPVFNMSLSNRVVVGGHHFTATVKASLKCTSWVMRFDGQTARTSNRSSFAHTFTTTSVTHKTVLPVTAQCTYNASAGAAGNSIRIAQATSPVLRSDVTLLPASAGAATTHHDDAATGGLPNTGGPGLWVLIAALALLGGGGVAMARSRRRSEAGSSSANPGVAG